MSKELAYKTKYIPTWLRPFMDYLQNLRDAARVSTMALFYQRTRS